MDDERGAHPARTAAAFAGIYLVCCAAYIWLSGDVAARSALSVQELQRAELVKGLAFVGSTSALFFVLAWLLLRRLDRQERELRRHREALLTAEVRAAAGIMAASVAHDINNVLVVAHLDVEALGKSFDAPEAERREAARHLADAVGEMTALARRLATIGRDEGAGRAEEIDVAGLVRDIFAFASRHRGVRPMRLHLEAGEAIVQRSHPELLRRALLNLMLNAAQAAEPGGQILVRLRAEGDAAVLEVHDDGPGVPEAQRSAIFDPFVSARGDGAGLGLLAVKACAEAHGARVEVDRSPILGGACFRIALRPARVDSEGVARADSEGVAGAR